MSTIIATIIVFAVIITIMAIGVILGRKPIQGSCGGLNNLNTQDGEAYCEICGADGKDKRFCD